MRTAFVGRRGRFSRRHVLLAGSGAAAVSLAGCDLLSTQPSDEGEEGQAPAAKGKEAPDLAALVRDGKLPPVEDRLPDNPLLIEPTERVGQYGGTLHNAIRSGVDPNAQVLPLASYDFLVRWVEDWTGAAGTKEVMPNAAESFEVSEDGRTFTFQLRRGMKWSDGEPFTADDIVFAVEDVLLNKQLFPVTPEIVSVDQEPATIEKLDDHSFTITFPVPRGLFLQQLAIPDTVHLTIFPRHYLEQFHEKYNPEVVQLVEEEGAADWVQLFGMKCGPGNYFGQNPDLPTIAAWRLTKSFAAGDSEVVLERNPYYWKVDPDGSQLPYLDELSFELVSNQEVLLLKAVNGEIDVELGPDTRFTGLQNKPVLARSRSKSGYRFVDIAATRCNVMAVYFNLTTEDAVKREIFRNRDFRIGLSYAIDRQELLATTMQGLGEPYQIAPLPDSPFYDEEMATQFLDYDVDLANQFLDRAFPERNGDGERLGPDGAPLRFTLEYPAEFRPEWQGMVELIESYWRAVGVHARVRNVSRNLQGVRMDANKHEATVFQVDQGLSMLVRPDVYMAATRNYARTWQEWYISNGSEGEEPLPAPKRQMELYDRIKSSPDAAEHEAMMTELLQIAKEEFYVIGTVRETQKYSIVSEKFHNIPKVPMQGWDYPSPGPTRPEQYFYAEGS